MIELINISKEYRGRGLMRRKERNRGVDGLNLSIEPGAYGLLGINGAGKTTTLKMIATLLRPSSGKIVINGLEAREHEKVLRRKINMITGSDRMLYFRLTGRENLHYFASLYGMGRAEAESRCDELLDLTGLSYARGKRVEQYSRGMKQRLAIARGLINDPEILLLDEPTLGLDVSIAAEIRTFIREVLLAGKERTLILTSHYMSEIEEICSEIGILQEGRLIYNGDLGGLYGRMGMEEVHSFSMPEAYGHLRPEIERIAACRPDWMTAGDGLVQFSMGAEAGYRFLKKMDSLNLTGLSYSQKKPGLEEAVMRLTSSGAGK